MSARRLSQLDLHVVADDAHGIDLDVLVDRRAEGLAELVDDSVGIGVASNRPEAYAEAIEALFASDLAAKRRAARALAEAHDWERVLPALLVQYRSLLSGAPAAEIAGNGIPAGAVHLR